MSKRRAKHLLAGIQTAASTVALWVAPDAYARRIRTRRALDFQAEMISLSQREAGGKDRFGGSGWIASKLSPDSDLDNSLEEYRNRARSLYHDDPVIHGWVEGCVTNVVGERFRSQARIRGGEGEPLTRERADGLKKQIERAQRQWAKRADRTGRKSLVELERMVERLFERDGEVFVVRSDIPMPGKPIPLALELVDTARIATPPGKEGDPNIRLGIRRDPVTGAPVSYFVRTKQPNDNKEVEEKYEEVPASRVLHICEHDDADQSRAVPRCTAVMRLMRNIKDFGEATLLKRQIEACVTVFIATTGDPVAMSRAASHDTNSNNERLEYMEPGRVIRGSAESEPKLLNPGEGAHADHVDYVEMLHRMGAAGLQYPFELLMKNYLRTSFAGGRLSLLDGRATFRGIQRLRIEQFYQPVWEWVIEELVLAGEVDISAREFLDSPETFTECVHIPPPWPWVDPEKEMKAEAGAVENKLDSRSNMVGARGYDDEELQEQLLREARRDADSELALRDYRLKIGLDEVPTPEDDEPPDTPPDNQGENEDESQEADK